MNNKGKLGDTCSNIHASCVFECNNDTCRYITENYRSPNYFCNELIKETTPRNLEIRKKYRYTCMLTSWGVSHILLYIILGISCPSCFYETFIIGILFEIVEHYVWKCGDALDILFNSFGFLIGAHISTYL